MLCYKCGAELEDGVSVCPVCGAELPEAEEAAAEPEMTESTGQEESVTPIPDTETEGAEETALIEDTAQTEDAPEDKKPGKARIIIAVAAAVVLMAALAVVLVVGIFGKDMGKTDPTDPTDSTASTEPFVSKTDYTGTDEEAVAAADTVVATMGGKKMTNSILQVYFSMHISEFISTNYSYLQYMGLDLEKPLNEQACYFDETISWEEYFVKIAINSWQNYQAVYLASQDAGYELPEDARAELDGVINELEQMRIDGGFDTVEEMIKSNLSVNCKPQDYIDYCTVYYTDSRFTDVQPTEKELEKCFERNKDTFAEQGITKDSGAIVDVRHILVKPEGGTEDANGAMTYSDAEWAACLAKAEDLKKTWESGEATEDSFAQLAKENSEDTGSAADGGLYTDITSSTSFVEPFLTWCMDKKRQVGDVEIVKTEYGYHIMYFSATQQQWRRAAAQQYPVDYTHDLIDESLEKWPMDIDRSKICLAEFKLV